MVNPRLTSAGGRWRFHDSRGPMGSEGALLDEFEFLTEYEIGRAQLAIEWVARAQKPIVEIGSRPISNSNLNLLDADLARCVAQSGENVHPFIVAENEQKYFSYGFYKYPWALDALQWITRSKRRSPDRRYFDWLGGLIFGYSPDAIQRFISSGSGKPTASLHLGHGSLGKGENGDFPAPRALRRSNPSGKRRRLR